VHCMQINSVIVVNLTLTIKRNRICKNMVQNSLVPFGWYLVVAAVRYWQRKTLIEVIFIDGLQVLQPCD
jgi:hypothetical protein